MIYEYDDWIKAGRPINCKVNMKAYYCTSCDNYVNHGCTKLNCPISYVVARKKECKLEQEHKMTRQEAIKKCNKLNRPYIFVEALEALGLIKFEEVKKYDDVVLAIVMKFVYDRRLAEKLVLEISERGYNLVKEQSGEDDRDDIRKI